MYLLDSKTGNSLKQYHKECMNKSGEKMHVDAGA